MEEKKKRIFSGIQPSGNITLGNYLGAVKNWSKLQGEYDCCYTVVDLHALTVRQNPAELRQRTFEMLAILLACGIDPEKSLLFIQSHVSGHAELSWILNCYTQLGELSRMTQFKDKSQKHSENVNAGLFTYPVLMAADILLYQTDLVPVGHDQKQHLELSRDIAVRFNNIYGNVFKIPEPYIAEVGARIMSLQNPTMKMSKSDENVNGYVSLIDNSDTIIKKFKRAVTDSDNQIVYKKGKDGINNLISIYCTVTGATVDEVQNEFCNKGYGDFKLTVGEAVAENLKPIQEKYKYYMDNKDYLSEIYTNSAKIAEKIAARTLEKVYKKVGLVPKDNKR